MTSKIIKCVYCEKDIDINSPLSKDRSREGEAFCPFCGWINLLKEEENE